MIEVDGIFSALDKFGRNVHLNDKRQKLSIQLEDAQSRRCGNCSLWMKKGCKPEKLHGQFKSSNSLACGDFNLSGSSGARIDRLENEIGQVDEAIKELTAEST